MLSLWLVQSKGKREASIERKCFKNKKVGGLGVVCFCVASGRKRGRKRKRAPDHHGLKDGGAKNQITGRKKKEQKEEEIQEEIRAGKPGGGLKKESTSKSGVRVLGGEKGGESWGLRADTRMNTKDVNRLGSKTSR